MILMFRRSASAVLVKELQAKIDKGDNVEFETQVEYFSFCQSSFNSFFYSFFHSPNCISNSSLQSSCHSTYNSFLLVIIHLVIWYLLSSVHFPCHSSTFHSSFYSISHSSVNFPCQDSTFHSSCYSIFTFICPFFSLLFNLSFILLFDKPFIRSLFLS